MSLLDDRDSLEDLLKKKPGENELKVVLVGDASVGKTCLI